MKARLMYLTVAFLIPFTLLKAHVHQEHEAFNSEPLSMEQWDNMIVQRQQETSLTGSNSILIVPIESSSIDRLCSLQLNSTASPLTIHQYHWIEDFLSGFRVALEDGSEWSLDPTSQEVIKEWNKHDTLVISPKEQFFWGSLFSFVITNKDRGTSVNANPYDGPIKFGTKSAWVRGISWKESQVCLLDGEGSCSRWEVSAVDKELFDNWSHNDTVIVGQNDSYFWWLSCYDYILINVKRNHYIRARFISSSCKLDS